MVLIEMGAVEDSDRLRRKQARGGVCIKWSRCPDRSLDWLDRVGKVDTASPNWPLVVVRRKRRSLCP